jgi:hypothetical protein
VTQEQLELAEVKLNEMVNLYWEAVMESNRWRERALKAEKKGFPIHLPWRKGVNDIPAKDQRPIY